MLPMALPANRALPLIFRLSTKLTLCVGERFTCPAVLQNLQPHNTNPCKTEKQTLKNLNLVFKKII